MARPELVPADPGWPEQFRVIRDDVGRLLAGPPRIDHIGSTSVPGLLAKDVIDLQIGVEGLDQADEVVERLAAAGYRPLTDVVADHVPAGVEPAPAAWAKRLLCEPVGRRRAHVHVRVVDAANWRYALLFAAYLRAQPRAAGAYAVAKLRLAALCSDSDVYSDAKDPVCDLIVQAAEPWALATDWQP